MRNHLATKSETNLSNMRRCALLVAAIVMLSLASTGCSKPTVKLDDVLLKQLTTSRLEVGLILDLFNPNSYALPLDKVDWRMELFSNPLANGAFNFNRQIRANGNTRVNVPIGLRFADIAVSAQKVLSSRTIPWGVGGQAQLRTPVGPVSVNFGDTGSWRNPLF